MMNTNTHGLKATNYLFFSADSLWLYLWLFLPFINRKERKREQNRRPFNSPRQPITQTKTSLQIRSTSLKLQMGLLGFVIFRQWWFILRSSYGEQHSGCANLKLLHLAQGNAVEENRKGGNKFSCAGLQIISERHWYLPMNRRMLRRLLWLEDESISPFISKFVDDPKINKKSLFLTDTGIHTCGIRDFAIRYASSASLDRFRFLYVLPTFMWAPMSS